MGECRDGSRWRPAASSSVASGSRESACRGGGDARGNAAAGPGRSQRRVGGVDGWLRG